MRFAKAITKNVRISPRKARLSAGLIRGLSVDKASTQLLYCGLKGGLLLKKTLDSAIANAEMQLDARRENLKVHEVKVDGGPVMKRGKSKNKGGTVPILKRTSHFTIVLATE